MPNSLMQLSPEEASRLLQYLDQLEESLRILGKDPNAIPASDLNRIIQDPKDYLDTVVRPREIWENWPTRLAQLGVGIPAAAGAAGRIAGSLTSVPVLSPEHFRQIARELESRPGVPEHIRQGFSILAGLSDANLRRVLFESGVSGAPVWIRRTSQAITPLDPSTVIRSLEQILGDLSKLRPDQRTEIYSRAVNLLRAGNFNEFVERLLSDPSLPQEWRSAAGNPAARQLLTNILATHFADPIRSQELQNIGNRLRDVIQGQEAQALQAELRQLQDMRQGLTGEDVARRNFLQNYFSQRGGQGGAGSPPARIRTVLGNPFTVANQIPAAQRGQPPQLLGQWSQHVIDLPQLQWVQGLNPGQNPPVPIPGVIEQAPSGGFHFVHPRADPEIRLAAEELATYTRNPTSRRASSSLWSWLRGGSQAEEITGQQGLFSRLQRLFRASPTPIDPALTVGVRIHEGVPALDIGRAADRRVLQPLRRGFFAGEGPFRWGRGLGLYGTAAAIAGAPTLLWLYNKMLYGGTPVERHYNRVLEVAKQLAPYQNVLKPQQQ